jgi:hypothetical protein
MSLDTGDSSTSRLNRAKFVRETICLHGMTRAKSHLRYFIYKGPRQNPGCPLPVSFWHQVYSRIHSSTTAITRAL